jgi:hypothetical protein
VRFEVEYRKDPGTTDEVLFHVVNLVQTKNSHVHKTDRNGRHRTRRLGQDVGLQEEAVNILEQHDGEGRGWDIGKGVKIPS